MTRDAEASIEEIIEKAWAARFARDIENCRILVASLRQKMSFLVRAFDQSHLDTVCDHHSPGYVAHLVCLVASLQRVDLEVNEAKTTLITLEQYFHSKGWALPFQLCFQKGLCEFSTSHFSTALDLFLAAKSAASNSLERSYSLSNALFCLEALGMPYAKTKEELISNIVQVRKGRSIEEVESQLDAFELRLAFRSAKMSEFLKKRSQAHKSIQSDYYFLWVSELPFHKASGSAQSGTKERFFLADPHFYQKSYRVRTLQGLLLEDDLKHPKETELADRIYLWTWRWLTGSDSLTIPRIMALLRHVDFLDLASRLTCEDYQLIRNSLLWLGLFDSNSTDALQKIAEVLRPVHTEDFPLFAFERNIISYLYAVRDHRDDEAQDLYLILESHPLWKSSEIYLADLVKGLDGKVRPAGQLKLLLDQIRKFNTVDHGHRDGVVVDLTSFEVSWNKNHKKVVSQPLCFAIESLFRKNPLEFEEILRICFGISQYDPLSHASKIFNLVARMKACLPEEMVLTSKNGKLYAAGSWSHVHFVRPHPLASALQNQPEWRALIRRRVEAHSQLGERWVRPAQILKKLSGQTTLKRYELEALTGKSRSTANRIISRWLAQGILKKSGHAKNTVYSFHSIHTSTHKKT